MAVDAELEIEIERKYDVAAPVGAPDLTQVAGVTSVTDPVEHRLTATYFDTADLRLLRARITLRRRVGGHDPGWHLKLPNEAGGRRELRLPLSAGADDRVPGPLQDLVLGRVRGAPLVPVARIRTHRTVRVLLGAGEQPLAELCDDRVSAQTTEGGPAVPPWHEWELELLEGPAELLAAAEPLLLAAGATPASGPSKLGRVLAGRLPPPPPDRPGPDPGICVSELLRDHVLRQADRLLQQDLLLRFGEHEGVHQMRIAARRLRSALATYRPVLEPGSTDELRDELRWLGRTLADARDAQVLGERLSELAAAQPPELLLGPVVRRIRDDLDAALRRGRDRADEQLRSERYFHLLDLLDAFVQDPPFTGSADAEARQVLPVLLEAERRRVRRRRKRWRKSGPEGHDRALHELRKAAKRLRYAAETGQPVFGGRASRLAAAAKGLQQLLGEHQDTVVARDALRELGVRAHLDGENGFSFGRLHGLEEARAVELVRQLPAAWAAMPSTELQTWLHR